MNGRSVVILVPVLGRPGHAQPFVNSLRTAGSDMRDVGLHVVANERDDAETAAAWAAAGVAVFDVGPQAVSFPAKVNAGVARLRDDALATHVVVVGDDVRFRGGWLDQALAEHTETGRQVIGLNDLGRSSSISATHWLVDLAYLDEPATWTDPAGVLLHEGYGHNWCDAELAAVAKTRGQWGYAPASVVEHMHHLFGRAAVDATYERGTATLWQDRELWEHRLATYGGDRAPASA